MIDVNKSMLSNYRVAAKLDRRRCEVKQGPFVGMSAERGRRSARRSARV